MATDTFTNQATTQVSSGGTTAPAPGTVETWTVGSSASFPTASVASNTVFRVVEYDATRQTEIILVTDVTGTTWTVTRGAEGTTPIAHPGGFTVVEVVTAAVLSSFVSKAGGSLITADAATTIGLRIRGAASQSANLQEWQNSSNTVLARVDNSGALVTISASGTAALTWNNLAFTRASTSYIQNTAVGGALALQTNNSASTVVTKVILQTDDNGILVIPGGTAGVGLVVRGLASQSADLSQWQNSGGTALAKIDSSGVLTAAGLVTGGALTVSGGGTHTITGNITETGQTISVPSVASQVPSIARAFASQSVDIFQIQAGGGSGLASGTILASFDSLGRFQIRPNAGAAGIPLEAGAFIEARATGGVPLVLRGLASQTASLQQWQNSAGTTMAQITPNGGFVSTTNEASSFGRSVLANTILAVGTGAAGNTGLVVQGVASQTGDLQEWQDNGGIPLAKVTSTGTIIVGGNRFYSSSDAATATTSAFLVAGSTTQSGLWVRGFSGQSVDLQQWQNNTGTPLASVSLAGQFVYGASSLGAAYNATLESGRVGVIVKRNTSTIVDFLRFADNSGNTLLGVDGYGGLQLSGLGASQTNKLWMGSGVPVNTSGADGDVYLNTTTGASTLYRRQSGAWVAIV